MTKGSALRSSAGFTYIAALVMVVIVGLLATQMAEVWSTKMRRERETELIFRGTQVRDALRRRYKLNTNIYGNAPVAGIAPVVGALGVTILAAAPRINELKDLLQASESAGKQHFLRPFSLKVNDPVTGKESDWELFKDPATQRITGVFIKSGAEPIKQDFSDHPDLNPDDFAAKKKYSDWVFICTSYPKPPAAGGVTGLPGSNNPSGNPTGATSSGGSGSGARGNSPGATAATTGGSGGGSTATTPQ